MKKDKVKTPKESHVMRTKHGMGDHLGTGFKAKIGTMRSGMGFEKLSKKQMKTPPKSVV